MELNNIIDIILCQKITNIDQIARFNGTPVHHKESVSEHSYWVALFASLLCEEMFVDKTPKTLKFSFEAIISCIFHDFNEIITGDVLFTLKYNQHTGREIKTLMQIFTEKEMKTIYKGNTGNALLKLIPIEDGDFYNFIKICDWLSCIKYLKQEQSMGNLNLSDILDKSLFHLRKEIDRFCISMIEEFGGNFNKNIFDQIKQDLYKC